MIRCGVCTHEILDHSEGELHKCLKESSIYIEVVREYVNKLRVLNQ